ncbi:HEPN domain-containing protein [Streptomyces sp. NPDC020472]|uniref:HEPN domain-containing protein n=1 Tax=Streptomyces sp. NPDC020472 TaxID=3365075 RepID=UPI0037AAFAEE
MPTNRSEARKQILSIKSELDSTYERYNQNLSDIDLSLHGDLHKYMCIRMAGYLEQLMFEAVTGYIASATGGPAGQFAMSWFRRSPNLTPDALIALIGRFGESWETEIRDFLAAEERRNNLGKLLEVRNKVAHGQSYSGGKMNVATYKDLVDSIHTWVLTRMID